MSEQQYFGLSDDMFAGNAVKFHSFKNGEHKFRVLPPYAPKKLFHKTGLHWGFTDESGHKKALVCTLEDFSRCPLCEKIDSIKGDIENLTKLKTQSNNPEEIKKVEEKIAELEKFCGDHRRKPMYLWNILTENGEEKVLQLSWNGHDPLYNKIKWWWDNKKVDITNPKMNYLMYCSRTGENAKTRFQYEVLDNFAKEITVPVLKDLSKIYIAEHPDKLAQVLSLGYVAGPGVDHSERNVAANTNTQQSAITPAQNQPANTQTTGQTQQASTQQNNVAAPVEPPVNTPAPENNQVQLTSSQDKELKEMMAALQG